MELALQIIQIKIAEFILWNKELKIQKQKKKKRYMMEKTKMKTIRME